MTLFGGMSKGERSRIRTRVRTATAAQTATQGRFLGGLVLDPSRDYQPMA
jgi:site-specific DNA recombinase